jgi:hypothetical protein
MQRIEVQPVLGRGTQRSRVQRQPISNFRFFTRGPPAEQAISIIAISQVGQRGSRLPNMKSLPIGAIFDRWDHFVGIYIGKPGGRHTINYIDIVRNLEFLDQNKRLDCVVRGSRSSYSKALVEAVGDHSTLYLPFTTKRTNPSAGISVGRSISSMVDDLLCFKIVAEEEITSELLAFMSM